LGLVQDRLGGVRQLVLRGGGRDSREEHRDRAASDPTKQIHDTPPPSPKPMQVETPTTPTPSAQKRGTCARCPPPLRAAVPWSVRSRAAGAAAAYSCGPSSAPGRGRGPAGPRTSPSTSAPGTAPSAGRA